MYSRCAVGPPLIAWVHVDSRTQIKRGCDNYFAFRLMRSVGDGTKVRQPTLLNMDRHFGVSRGERSVLCRRIPELLDCGFSLSAIQSTALEEQA